jgi:hypothetical protein
MSIDSKTKTKTTEVDVHKLLDSLLEYFDHYWLATVAPLVAELELALDSEYRRGIREMASRAVDILDNEGHLGISRRLIEEAGNV